MSPNRSGAYAYDADNRLWQVSQGGSQLKAFGYDADGALRTRTDGTTLSRRYVTPDYHLELPSGQPVVHYRFGGRTVAYAGAAGPRYVLADQLGSDQGELNGVGDAGQTRYTPFGSDRAVSGSTGVTDEERYTGQRRADDGGGNANQELYHYGARAYLPGLGIFTQADSIVPDPKRPEALNRYAYSFNNPLKYVDPTGHLPEGADPDWAREFQANHGSEPTAQDWADRQFSMVNPGTGPGGSWTSSDWHVYQEV